METETKVINITNGNIGCDIYIGRPRDGRPWGFGNPFSMPQDGNRKEVIFKFEMWLKEGRTFNHAKATNQKRQWILENLHTLKGRTLGCFCAPRPCHGDVLKRLADALDT